MIMLRSQGIPWMLLWIYVVVIQAQEEPQWSCKPSNICYSSDNNKTDYSAAKEKCRQRGGVLACPSTKEKVDEFYAFIQHKEDGYWVGLKRNSSSDDWAWLDGTNYYDDAPWATGHRLNNKSLAYFKSKTFISTSETTQDLYYTCQIAEHQLPSSPSSSIPTSISTETTNMPIQQPMRENNCSSANPSRLAFIDCSSECGDNDGWSKSPETGNCYYYAYTGSLPWTELKGKCEKIGGHLAVPSASPKLKELLAYIQYRDPCLYEKSGWIGLYLPETISTNVSSEYNKILNWSWVDGSSYDWNTTEWSHEEPADRERWVRVRGGKFYATGNVSDASYYICQKESDATVTSSMPGPSASNATNLPSGAAYTSPVTTESSAASISPDSLSSSTISSTATEPSTQHRITMTPTPGGQFILNAQVCGDHAGWHLNTATNTCYSLEESHQSTWSEIRQKYSQQQGDLASPSTPEKYREILQFIAFKSANTVNVWIGLHCKEDIGSNETCSYWEWVNGSPYNMEWNEWAEKEPGEGEKWVRVRDRKWYASNDENDATYSICEKAGKLINMPPVTPAPPPQSSTSADSQTPEINVTANTTNWTQRNMNLLALLILIIPIVAIIAVVFLVKTRRLDVQPMLNRILPKKAKDPDAETPMTPQQEPEADPYYLSTNTAIPVDQLENFSSTPDQVISMHLEFESIPAHMGLAQTIANKPVNKTKNRFKDIKPFDANRVELSVLPGQENSDYINASFIDSYEGQKKFIASCGPTQQTMADFWRMIWEYNIKCVVMLTQLMEGAKEMCKQYWPSESGKAEKYGDLEVILEQEDKLTDYTCRHLKVIQGDEERQVIQLHTESWLDMRILDSAVGILNLRREMRKFIFNNSPPILLHCRAGVGRTGTFLALDYLLQQAATEGVVDVAKCVAKLRKQRVKMVQNVDQYEFLYQAVAEGVTLGNTCIPVSQFLATYPKIVKANSSGTSKVDFQFKLMLEPAATAIKLSKRRKSMGLHTVNKLKNRSKKVVADDSFRISLVTKSEGRNDYINAVAVDSLERKYAFIATQAPLVGTAVDLWRAVWDCKCRIIVMLCPQEQLEVTEIYYPEVEEDIYSVPPFEIECTSVKTRKQISSKEFALSLSEKRHVLHLSVTSDLGSKSSLELLETFLAIYGAIKKRKTKYSHTAPTLVHCLDGAEWTGMYCAFSCLMDQIESDQEIDVFQVCRLVKHSRKEFISTKNQYTKLYEMMYYYINGLKKKNNNVASDVEDSNKTEDERVTIYDNVKQPVASSSNIAVATPVGSQTAVYVNAAAIDRVNSK